ncbi:tetratricopeptide repeat protein [Nodosilinea sp. P-1105]|uniref:tetratricopeptide repeat protein n=1 Tax=Nodosilinea sp. P-1105 TaxID=2546229 RepID=UPI00146A84CC|nr:tetratricopeptide repeat protein [Nodosilinea sp. P-1105]
MADNHWLTRAERALVVGSGVGAVASMAAQNAALATAPLTVMAAIGLLNRNRVEQQLDQAQAKLARQQRQTSHRLTNLSKQVSALPSPEALTNFQRSVMARNNRAFMQFSNEISQLRHEVNDQIQQELAPDLSQIQAAIGDLQEQYTQTQVGVQNLTSYMQRLATLPRLEALEGEVSQVRTDLMQARIGSETLRSETRTLVTHLQATVQQLEQRLQNLTQRTPPGSTGPEITEIMKAISHLVDQTEFTNLVNHVRDLTRQQANLERALTKVPVGAMGDLSASDSAAKNAGKDLKDLVEDLNQLKLNMQALQQQVNQQETTGQSPEQVQQVVSQHLGQLKAQLSKLAGANQSLAERQQRLGHQWAQVLPQMKQGMVSRQAMAQLTQRLGQTEAELNGLRQSVLTPQNSDGHPQDPSWILDFINPDGAAAPNTNASRQALDQAIAQAQQRLILVWPWAHHVAIDDELLSGLVHLLQRGGQVDIGWCHQADPGEGRLIWRISQRWDLEPNLLSQLKVALSKLLPLRETYPDRFRFKIMGSAESYVVCDSGPDSDRTYAIVSLKPFATASTPFPQVDAKLRTADPQVVQGLIQRFQNPTITPGDKIALFNRGTTRHDLRDQPGAISDYTHVLRLQPDHAIVLNNRGAAHLELNHTDQAELDFTQALEHNPKLFAAYCNRGWLRLEQRRYPAAIQDFTQAIALKPHLPMAYVYRGSALQKLGDLKGAVRDYSDAIACGDPIALPYCYRSTIYQSQGDHDRAIADLQRASDHLAAQGDRQGLASVQRALSRLREGG